MVKCIVLETVRSSEVDSPFSEHYKFLVKLLIRYDYPSGYSVTRRHVSLEPFYGNGHGSKRMPYSRYLMHCYLWKTEGRLIPDGLDVDHVNGNPLDDRLENLEVVTRQENIRRRDILRYKSQGVDPEVLNRIRYLITNGQPRSVVYKELHLSPNYLRYLISEYLPDLDTEEVLELNMADIIHHRKLGMTLVDLAEMFGTSKTSIMRLIRKNAPELDANNIRKKKREQVAQLVARGLHYKDIAKELGMEVSAALSRVQRQHPEAYAKMIS